MVTLISTVAHLLHIAVMIPAIAESSAKPQAQVAPIVAVERKTTSQEAAFKSGKVDVLDTRVFGHRVDAKLKIKHPADWEVRSLRETNKILITVPSDFTIIATIEVKNYGKHITAEEAKDLCQVDFIRSTMQKVGMTVFSANEFSVQNQPGVYYYNEHKLALPTGGELLSIEHNVLFCHDDCVVTFTLATAGSPQIRNQVKARGDELYPLFKLMADTIELVRD